MIKKLGGTRAILAYMIILGFLGLAFLAAFHKVPSDVFIAVSTLAGTIITSYFNHKANQDKVGE